jgi:hypothetical protein
VESSNGEAALLASGVDMRGLRRCPVLKNRMETFLATSSCPLIDPIASRDGGRSNLGVTYGSRVFFILWTKFELISPIFIEVFAPTRRGLGDQSNLSLSRLPITLDKDDSAWG